MLETTCVGKNFELSVTDVQHSKTYGKFLPKLLTKMTFRSPTSLNSKSQSVCFKKVSYYALSLFDCQVQDFKKRAVFIVLKSCQNMFPAKVNLAVSPKFELCVNLEKLPENYNEQTWNVDLNQIITNFAF